MSVTAVPIRPIKKGSVVKLWAALGLLSAAAGGLAWAGTSAQQVETTASGLKYRVVKPGTGPRPTVQDIAIIDYTGRLSDGSVFDTSEGKQPIPIPVGPGGSIPGFSEGLQMMQKGGTYQLIIPWNLAYGAEGRPPVIPPKADLEFEVTLIDFLPQEEVMRRVMQGQGQGQAPGM
jgi:FKBP-type peptidyl-prolyl cis-trans isomerase FkpA